MPQNVHQMSDHALVVELMVEDFAQAYDSDDDRLRELNAELERRYPGSGDRLADHVTGHRMTGAEAVVWAGAHWEESCRGVVVPPTETGWVVVTSSPGMPLDNREGAPRTGVNMMPCPVEEARAAVDTVHEDQLHRDIRSIREAFEITWREHPGRDMAAYILDHGNGTFTVAV